MMKINSIGNKIIIGRKKINLSQADLAKELSISSQAVGKWERGESMPDISTLNRLAAILGVDLNYFSDNFNPENTQNKITDTTEVKSKSENNFLPESSKSSNWNMSSGNWADADFSGLKNLKEKFSSSNMKNCKFKNSDLSELLLKGNNIEKCDFSASDIRNSKIQSSNLLSNQFNKCSFIDTEFLKNNIGKCDFSEANFSGTEFIAGYFENNIIENAKWNFTIFKNMGMSDIILEGTIDNCHFEACTFYRVKFQNAILNNTFFKYNRKMKKVEFINCKADKLTYAFLKNNEANLTGITILE